MIRKHVNQRSKYIPFMNDFSSFGKYEFECVGGDLNPTDNPGDEPMTMLETKKASVSVPRNYAKKCTHSSCTQLPIDTPPKLTPCIILPAMLSLLGLLFPVDIGIATPLYCVGVIPLMLTEF